jgi:two-component system, OmpR family, alkaline phosphatase synthesis response regulator PhoP
MSNEDALRILLVDDDKDLLDLLKYNFQKDGFNVKTVSKATKALHAAATFLPELIVLDVSMPDGSGIELCKEIRAAKGLEDSFIFFLSARSIHAFRKEALEIGADDFIEKLGGLRALTNKVNAVLRNNFVIKKGISGLAANELVVDKKAQAVYLKDRKMPISDPEFEILFFLMQNPNKVISRVNLIKILWGSELYMLDSSVQTYVESLQRKIGTKFIETVSTGQYRFVYSGY